MNNLYEYNLESNFRKLECDGLLFVEFQCLPGAIRSGVWSQHGYIAYGLSGKKTWISPEGEFVVYKGDALYCKKGGQLVHHYYKEQFCALLFFFPEEFIRKIVLEFKQENPSKNIPLNSDAHIIRMNVDLRLETFFESVMSYFFVQKNPSRDLLKLKFKELVLQVLSSNENPELAAYFFSLAKEEQANLKDIMLDNYLYHLSLEEFAKLCHRSLSTFKRDFKDAFGQPPGKWLNKRRMEYARMRLLTTEESITDVAFHSGYQATSHFIRRFKKQYGLPPQQFRMEQTFAKM